MSAERMLFISKYSQKLFQEIVFKPVDLNELDLKLPNLNCSKMDQDKLETMIY
jgi:hypothetical protein